MTSLRMVAGACSRLFLTGLFVNVIVDLCVVPLGVGVSVSRYVGACQQVLDDAGLNHHMHAYGTNIEGDWDDVFAAIKLCHEKVHAMGGTANHHDDQGRHAERSQSDDAG